MVPCRLIKPSAAGEPKATTNRPNPRLRRWRLLMKPRQPHPRVVTDLVEAVGGVAEPEVRGPATQEPVHALHDRLDGQQQPGPVGDLPKLVTGMLHGLVRGSAGQEHHPPAAGAALGADQPVMKPQEGDCQEVTVPVETVAARGVTREG